MLQSCLEEEAYLFCPTHSEEDYKRRDNSPRITVRELQRKVASSGHEFSKTTITHHLHAKKLFGRYARKKAIHVISPQT